MRERLERYDPHRLLDLVSYSDQNNLRSDLCICFNHQIVEIC
jgi:hypothetical protein